MSSPFQNNQVLSASELN